MALMIWLTQYDKIHFAWWKPQAFENITMRVMAPVVGLDDFSWSAALTFELLLAPPKVGK